MKKKGFTLIELLAVIVILAIIALIATPIVMNVIENARKGAAERSAENYMDAVETAIATERLDNNILEGEYEIQSDGNLCPVSGCGNDNEYKVNVDMNGNKPTDGTIFIENGQVVPSLTGTPEEKTTVSIGSDYTVSYDANGKITATKKEESGNTPKETICTYKGTDASKKYEYGAEYECNPGDGVKRTFYVLENNEITDNVSLIMDNDVGYSKWCNELDTSCEGSIALEFLNSKTSSWTVKPTLPTVEQILAIDGYSIKDAYSNENVNLSSWLTSNINGTYDGYWTLTAPDGYGVYTIETNFEQKGYLSSRGADDTKRIRPVIIIPIGELG